jgi:hypothetical protein
MSGSVLYKVTGICGVDRLYNDGNTAEGPVPLPADVVEGDLSALKDRSFDLLIVGAGLSGCVIAERCSKELGMTSLIIDVRDHIGGNCYDYVDEHGIRCSKYGAHLFHTQFPRVWDYVQVRPLALQQPLSNATHRWHACAITEPTAAVPPQLTCKPLWAVPRAPLCSLRQTSTRQNTHSEYAPLPAQYCATDRQTDRHRTL